MRGLKGVLQCLSQWIQAAADRILELPKRRTIKRKISRYYTKKATFKYLDRYSLKLHWEQELEPEAFIYTLIAAYRMEEDCDYVCRVYGRMITERCTAMMRPYV